MTTANWLDLVRENGLNLHQVPLSQFTPELCLAAVRQNALVLAHIPVTWRTPELCLAAVRNDGDALRHVPELLRTPEVCLAAVRQHGHALESVPYPFKTPELCMEAVRQTGWALAWVPSSLQTAELCLAAVQQTGLALSYVPESLKTPQLCLIAARQDAGVLEDFIPQALREQIRAALTEKPDLSPAGRRVLADLVNGAVLVDRGGGMETCIELGSQGLSWTGHFILSSQLEEFRRAVPDLLPFSSAYGDRVLRIPAVCRAGYSDLLQKTMDLEEFLGPQIDVQHDRPRGGA